MSKVTIIGGGGVRAPLLIHGLAQSQSLLGISDLTLFDIDPERTETIARIGREIARRMGGSFRIGVTSRLEEAAEGARFVLSSIRVGGIAARARDERLAIEHGLAGQETTGPAGAAMALRTLPVTLGQAKVVERVSPGAWFINFTNPAGLITQALTQNTSLKVIGICDTPSELFHRIAEAVGASREDMVFDYAGLNHLGWIRRVHLRGEDITDRLLQNADLLRSLYPADLFDPVLIQTLRLIPTEYLFFYYSQQKAHRNQLKAGASRGEELGRLNAGLFEQLKAGSDAEKLEIYRTYLRQRNASYMKLEGHGGSAFNEVEDQPDPFDAATGYHRIALDVMSGLVSDQPREVVLNVQNRGAIEDLDSDDIVEVPCDVDRRGAHPRRTGRLPDSVRGLTQSVKAYERTAIRAALEGSRATAQLALLEYPAIGQWELAGELLSSLAAADPDGLSHLK
ncbi:MAG: glycoside hydrolase, family 4 [Bryobacterales bacterium]|nr:glycoside hydrolase, family 4 [Bryobacterales bacterium]